MKIYIDNCYSTLSQYVHEIDRAITVSCENYFFSQKYKAGLWDGKHHFLKSSSLKFPTGLLNIVIDAAKSANIEVELMDNRQKPFVDLAKNWKESERLLAGIEMRDYQLDALVAAFEKERGCLEMATASGKTEVAAAIIKVLGLRTIFLVHTRDLLRQTKERFELRLGEDIGMLGEGVSDLPHRIVVATVQSVDAWLKKDERAAKAWLKTFSVLFLDECHHASAKTWEHICLLTQNAYFRFGLSGTILRRDDLSNMRMLSVFGPAIYRLPAAELIKRGYLSGIVVNMVDNPEVIDGTSWQQVYSAGIVESVQRNAKIIGLALEEFRLGRRVMILVRQIRHGEILLAGLQTAAVPTVFLHGSTDSEERESEKKRFNTDGNFVLIASVIFDEGVDIPEINSLIIAAGGKSEIRVIQRVGRGLRKKADNGLLTVFDFMDSSKFLRKHSAKRLAVYRKEQFIGKGEML